MKKFIYAVLLTGITYVSLGDVKKEIENCIKKDVNSKEFQQAEKLINFLQEQGNKLSKQGKYEEAMQCYQKALAQADKLYGKESTAAAMLYTSKGTLFLKQGEKVKAADNFVTAAEIYKKSMGAIVRPKAGRLLLMYAGFFYYDSKCNRKAWQTLIKSEKNISKFSIQEKKRYIAKFYRYLSLALYKDKKYKKAIPYLKKYLSIESQKKPLNYKNIGIINLSIADALINIGEYNDALVNLKKTENFFSLSNITDDYKYELFFYFSVCYKFIDKQQKNLIYSKKINEIGKNFKDNDYRKILGIVSLADAMYLTGQKKDAVEWMKKAIGLAKKQKEAPRTIQRLKKILKDMAE